MRKIAVLLLLGLLAGPSPARAQEPVDDGFAYVREDTTWARADSPVRIGGVVVVDEGVTLTIESGVRTELVGLQVRGGLVAEGTPGDPIVFSGYRRRWDGIRIEDVDGPRPGSVIRDVTVENASWGISMHDDAFPVEDSTFTRNGTGLVVTNADRSVSFTGNRFFSNEVAFKGKATGFVGVYSNDFWDNDVSLLFEAQNAYACGKEPGTFDVRHNDILRGPEDRWYSFDVHASDESRGSGMVVSAPDNWWGTTNRDDIRARLRPRIVCCPGPEHARIDWREPATGPQTPAEPPGPAGNPSPEPVLHGDPAYYTVIRRPANRECVSHRSLRRLRGVVFEGLGAAPERLTVALVRIDESNCESYDPSTRKFSRVHSCGEPFTFEVLVRHDGRFTVDLRRRLGPGKYTFHAGGDVARFRVLRD